MNNKIVEYIKKYNVLILLFLGFLIYIPSLFFDFITDDFVLLTNQYLNDRLYFNILDFFKPNYVRNDIYMPITSIIHWLIIKFFGQNSFVFHLVNLIFYILSSIVLFYLLTKIVDSDLISFFAMVLYILHPCHIENTAWISAMGYNISALFFFLSFLLFIYAFDENKKLHYLYSVISYIFAILSQPISVTLPAILFLWVFCFRREKFKESIKYICGYIPFLFIYLYLYSQTILKTERFTENINYTLLEKFSIWGFNILNSFIPINLCPVQPIPNIFYIIYLLVFIILCFYLRTNKIFLFFCWFGIISILPYSNIFFNIEVPIADRYLLLFSVTSCILISFLSFYFLEKFKNKNLLKYIVFLFSISLYLFSFIFYLPVWENNKKIWSYSYNINPNNLFCVDAYAWMLFDEGKYDEALFLANKILEKKPNSLSGYKIKIQSLIAKGYILEAKKLGLEILKLSGNNYEIYLSLFDISILLQDYDGALKFLEKANIIVKDNDMYNNEQIYFFAQKYIILSYINVEIEKFIENFRIISNDFKLLRNGNELSKILEKDDYKNREEICLNYLKKYNDKNYSQYIVMLLNCLYMEETYNDKSKENMKILFGDMNKANTYLQKGDIDSAEKIYLSIISKDKYMCQAYYSLGMLYLQTNRLIKAKKVLERILEINPNDEQVKQLLYSIDGKK